MRIFSSPHGVALAKRAFSGVSVSYTALSSYVRGVSCFASSPWYVTAVHLNFPRIIVEPSLLVMVNPGRWPGSLGLAADVHAVVAHERCGVGARITKAYLEMQVWPSRVACSANTSDRL